MFFFAFACLVSSSQKKVSEPVVIDVQKQCDFAQQKQECIGQFVQIKGSVPQMVFSHPILSSPSGVDSVQKYIQVGELQLIILSEGDWTCSGDVQVNGILKEIDMGGPEGTRGSYRNYYVSKSEIQCLS